MPHKPIQQHFITNNLLDDTTNHITVNITKIIKINTKHTKTTLILNHATSTTYK
jgi:hypothetical protein